MLPDRVSNPGPLTYESGALPIALRGPACGKEFASTGALGRIFCFPKANLVIGKSMCT